MPLTQSGIEYVSKGFDSFIKDIGEASLAITKLGRMTENRLAALREFGVLLDKAGEAAKKSAQAINDSTSETKSGAIGAASAITGMASKMLGAFAIIVSGAKLLEKEVGGVFKGIGKASMTWGVLGGAAGAIMGMVMGGPAVALAVGQITAMAGAVMGAFTKLINNIVQTVITVLPKALASIARAGISIGKAIFDFGKSVLSAVVKVASTILSPIKSLLTTLFNSIFGMFSGGGGQGGGWRSLGGSIFTAMFKFEALKQIIRGLINEIKALASASFGAAVELQVLAVRLDNLIAMKIRDAKITTNYGESIKIASGYTQELLGWIQKLALATPVSLEDISNMTYLGLAMGWSVTAAKTLTKAIVDYTAAIGMGSEISERIIYNFAQMKQQGKVTGTELRDLGRGAFMPINEILRQMYENIYKLDKGMSDTTVSFQEFRDMASAGTLPVEEFFKAFEDFVATNMPDMAYKMNYTFKAVLQNVQDLFKILVGWNVLGPMIASITKPIQDFVNNFKSAIMLAKANAIGKSMAFIVDSIRTGFSYISMAVSQVVASLHLPVMSIENIVKSMIKFGLTLREIGRVIMDAITKYILPITTKIGDKFNSDFSSMSKDFFDWGANLIFNFASGMMKAAVSVLTAAMNFIASILTSWLSPGSPPKILPDIDKWGMETMNEYLHGFAQADFDILKDMQGVIKDALGALVNLGMMTEIDSSSMYIGLTEDLIRAMDELNRTGTISASIFERLASIGGVFGQELVELLQLQLQYADATKIAEQAQIDYDNAIKATQLSSGKANKLIKEYNKMLRQGASKGALKDKLKMVNLSQIELAAAIAAEKEKKTALEVAQENLKALKDSIELQKSLIQALVDLAQAQKDASTAAGGGASAIEDLTDAIEGLGDAFGGGGSKGFKIDFDALKAVAETQWILLMESLKGKWADMWKANVSDPNSPFQKALGTLKTAWISAWDEMAKAVKLPSWEEIMNAWDAPVGGAGGPARGPDKRNTSKTLLQRFQDVIELFAGSLEAGGGGILGALGRVAGYIISKIAEKINSEENRAKIITALNTFMGWLTNLILGSEQIHGTTPEGGAVTGTPSPWATRLANALIEGLKSAVTIKINAMDWGLLLKQIAQLLIFRIPTFMLQVGFSIVEGIWSGIILKILTWLGTKIGEACKSIADFFAGFFEAKSPSKVFERMGADLIQGLYNGIVLAITSLWSTVEVGFETFMTNVRTFFFGSDAKVAPKDGGKMYVVGSGILENFIAGLESMKNTVWAKITEVFGPLADLVKLIFGEGSPSTIFFDIAVNIAQGFINGMDGMKDKVAEKTAEMFKKIPKDTKIRYEVESPSKLFERIGASAFPAISVNAPMMSSPVASNRSANFGDVNINSPIDFATFKAMVNKVLIEDG